MRAVIYARYSSDLQSEASIDDQLSVCRDRAEREGWTVVGSYTDRCGKWCQHSKPTRHECAVSGRQN